jgi:hypothetical protein
MSTCTVHVLSSRADRSYSTTTFTIGDQVKQVEYDRFKDDNGDLYLVVYLDESKVQSRVVLRHDWDRAKTAVDREHAAKSGNVSPTPHLG